MSAPAPRAAPRSMGWANRITLGRGVLTAALWALLALAAPDPSASTWQVAFVLFVVTAATDVLDGAVARRFGEVSRFGRIADPLVDKLLVLGTLVVLLGVPAVARVLPAWAVALILAREMVVTAVRGAAEGAGKAFGAVLSGKVKMVLQCVALGAVLLFGAGVRLATAPVPGLAALPGGEATWSVAHALVWLATLFTLWTGVTYVHRAVGLLRGS